MIDERDIIVISTRSPQFLVFPVDYCRLLAVVEILECRLDIPLSV